MALPHTIKTLAGTPVDPALAALSENPSVPLNLRTLAAALVQLQNTVNELISRHNELCDDTTHVADKVTGDGAAATNLFTT